MGLCLGNAEAEAIKHRGWVTGHFMPEGDLHYSRDVEIKWGKHKAGEKSRGYPEWSAGDSTTCTILISGKIRQEFQQHNIGVVLENEGDYALFGPGVPHRWEVLEDTRILTVRWPSGPK